MSTTRALARWTRTGLSGLVAAALLVASTPASANPWAAASSATLAAKAAPAEPATVDAALEAGDLTTAKSLAQQAREAEPSAATWQQEGEVLEAAGEYGAAADAYRSAKEAAGEDAAAVGAAEAGLTRVRASARGTVADEPTSTHREELDERWEPPKPKEPAPEPEPEPEPLPPQGGKIVTKWYFWVTVGAIVASAAAVTAIAIRAARDEQPDSLDSMMRAPGPRGPGVLRF